MCGYFDRANLGHTTRLNDQLETVLKRLFSCEKVGVKRGCIIWIVGWRLAGRSDIYNYCMIIRDLEEASHRITAMTKSCPSYKDCNHTHFWASLCQASCEKSRERSILLFCLGNEQ